MPSEVFSTQKTPTQILKDHFDLLYFIFAENKLVPNACFESTDHTQRCLSGIPEPHLNAVFGAPQEDQDNYIQKQLDYFTKAKTPFVWYLDENSHQDFQQKLLNHGFQEEGIFRGVIGSLEKTISIPEIPNDCSLEYVENESMMDEFNELVCQTFGMKGLSKDLYKKVLWNATKDAKNPMFHWILRKEGTVISALSTLIEEDIVSFWNGATLFDFRRQGFSTALRRFALQDAILKGCRLGASYLMAEGLALGICQKLGYQTQWRFNVFLSPKPEAL